MNKFSRFLALCLAFVMAVSACALALAETADENPVLMTFDGEPITKADADEIVYQLLEGGYITSETDYATALEYMINDRVMGAKIQEYGLDQFTSEEEDALRAEANDEWESAIEEYVNYFLSEDTEAARAQCRKDGDAYYRSNGYSPEGLYESLKVSASYEKLLDYMTADRNITPTEEEIQAAFEEFAAQDQAMFQDNISTYEFYKNYYGMEPWYIPEGYRGVLHILLTVDEDLMFVYESAAGSYEDSITEEAPDGDPDLKADLEQASADLLASRQEDIDAIYAALAKGETFISLIEKYGEDPGMQEESNLLNGYEVHKDSYFYDSAFVQGAFSAKMVKPGDVSDPVIGANGIHIIYYLRNVPGGFVELNDDIRQEITDYLENQNTNAVYSELVNAWIGEHEIVYNQDVIDALTAVGITQDAPDAEDDAE